MSRYFKALIALIVVTGAAPCAYASDDASVMYFYQQGRIAAQRMQASPLSDAEISGAVKGFRDQIEHKKSAYSKEQLERAAEQYHQRAAARREKVARRNLEAGAARLEKLHSDSRYQFSDRGAAWRFDHRGKGKTPQENDSVLLSYVGRHLDGKVFDRSDKPKWQSLKMLLPGWRGAVASAPVGSRLTVVVPHYLAWGERGAPPRIGPNETLIFTLDIKAVRSQGARTE